MTDHHDPYAGQHTPPHDLDAERAVITAALESKRALEEAASIISAADFYRPAHEEIWAVCLQLHEARDAVDVITVNAALQNAGKTGALQALLQMRGQSYPLGEVQYHARIVWDRARLRSLSSYADQLKHVSHHPGDSTAEEVIAYAADKMRALRDTGVMADEDMTAITLDELLAMTVTHDWVVPGLLERGDRLLLTGSEGLGKSYISRQIAVCAAAGLHPFRFEPAEPQKVLVVDAENSLKINIRAYGWMRAAARTYGVDPGNRLLLESMPYGMDVMDPRQGNKLIRLVEMQQPDLIVIGPLYKIHELDDEKAGEALRIQHYLDRVRAVCGSALVMELHSPHGSAHGRDPRPAGSSVWRRWPEFGFGLMLAQDNELGEEYIQQQRLCDLRPWRGPRDERDWPIRLRGGKTFPWIPANIEERDNPGTDAWSNPTLQQDAG